MKETFAGVFVSDEDVDTGESAFGARPELGSHLGIETFLGLAREPSRVAVIEHHPERREMKAGLLLALAIALARRWGPWVRGRRVGIVLPPGLGAFLANLAVVQAGGIPVNLNFTVGRAAAAAAVRKAGIERMISAKAMRERVTDFPWPEEGMVDVRGEIAACGKAAVVGWLLAIRLFPARSLARRLGVPERGGAAEAALLFTSGSSGEPKGVVLTHRNIIGNCLQTLDTGILKPGNALLGCLPVFHSFGFTVTMWFPLIHGLTVSTFPSPLETRRLAEIIAAEKVGIMVGAPTFLRPFLKRAEPAQLASLRTVIAGAEKLPRDLFDGFRERFGVEIHEGYGLTETSPVLAVNRTDPVPLPDGGEAEGSRVGTVGLMLSGMRARILDPQTLETLPRGETGLLAVRGCNVFGGYLDDPESTAEVLRDGWFVTGDLARFDDDGFLRIEGRLSRFSKIGGEMVPHITVEQKIIELFGWTGAEKQPLVVVGVPDEAKGEALVALTTEDVSVEAVRSRLAEAGMPNLWIPKRVVRLPAIPTLNTGKLDLRGCRRAAEDENPSEAP